MKRCLLFSILVSSCYLSMGQITATFKPNATVGKDAPIMKFDNNCIGYGDSLTPANINYGAEIINGDTCTDFMKLCLGDVPRKVAEINTETEEIFVPQGVVPLGDEVGEMPDRETLKAVPNPNSGECSLYFDANESDFASLDNLTVLFSDERPGKLRRYKSSVYHSLFLFLLGCFYLFFIISF